jgi:hypothetical protein
VRFVFSAEGAGFRHQDLGFKGSVFRDHGEARVAERLMRANVFFFKNFAMKITKVMPSYY